MKKYLPLLSFLLWFTPRTVAETELAVPAELRARTEKPAIEYRVGEPIRFTLELLSQDGTAVDGNLRVQWSCRGDDGQNLQGECRVSELPATIETSLSKAGFVWLSAKLLDEAGEAVKTPRGNRTIAVEFNGGAGAEILRIEAVPEPADFDAFWQRRKQELAAVPMEVLERKLVKNIDNCDIYAVKVACAGPRPVTGYLTIPHGAAPKSLPARAEYFGYSWRRIPVPAANADRIVFWMSAHGAELDREPEYYDRFFEELKSNGYTQGFDPADNRDPEHSFFAGMAMRVLRSLEFLKSLPEWDGRTLEVNGGSQGGLQSVWGAALDHDVTRANAWIIWCCDLGGTAEFGRVSGPWRVPYVPELGYFDAANHAKRIAENCFVDIHTAGLGDYISPPSGLAIFFRNLKCPARIQYLQGAGHTYRPALGGMESFTLSK